MVKTDKYELVKDDGTIVKFKTIEEVSEYIEQPGHVCRAIIKYHKGEITRVQERYKELYDSTNLREIKVVVKKY